jgi:hypothetical protein
MRLFLLLILGWACAPRRAVAVTAVPPMLYQEDALYDGLYATRSRAARQSADPNLLPVLQNITLQLAQQALNLKQIEAYTKVQQDNLHYAAQESDPSESLATI